MDLQRTIRQYRRRWLDAGQWQDPLDLGDCLAFMLTEVAEAIDAHLRTKDGYVRNHRRPSPTPRQIAAEVFDAIMMGVIALDILGLELDDVAREKLAWMDAQRVA